MTIELHHGDCLDVLPGLPDHSFDAIIADLPYGTTACKWDTVIPFEPLWKQYKRLIKKRGAIVLFGSQPFTSALVMSNVEWFKYSLVWNKKLSGGALNADVAPLKIHEDILIFCDGSTVYNKQMRKGKPRVNKVSTIPNGDIRQDKRDVERGYSNPEGLYNPVSILEFSNANRSNKVAPTQKPVALLEYLIRTYTNPGDRVLDNTMGSGTTLVACVHTGRNGTGIEMLPAKADDPDYFGIAQIRIEKAQSEIVQLTML